MNKLNKVNLKHGTQYLKHNETNGNPQLLGNNTTISYLMGSGEWVLSLNFTARCRV